MVGREQPAVRFRQEALVEAYTTTASSQLVALGWSSSSEINSALGARLRPSELRAWTEDDARDGRVETLAFQLRVPLAAGERMHSVSLMVGLDVIFDRATSLRMNSSLFVQHSSPLSGLRSSQSADLVLVSERALRGANRVARAPCNEHIWMLQAPPNARPPRTPWVEAPVGGWGTARGKAKARRERRPSSGAVGAEGVGRRRTTPRSLMRVAPRECRPP